MKPIAYKQLHLAVGDARVDDTPLVNWIRSESGGGGSRATFAARPTCWPPPHRRRGDVGNRGQGFRSCLFRCLNCELFDVESSCVPHRQRKGASRRMAAKTSRQILSMPALSPCFTARWQAFLGSRGSWRAQPPLTMASRRFASGSKSSRHLCRILLIREAASLPRALRPRPGPSAALRFLASSSKYISLTGASSRISGQRQARGRSKPARTHVSSSSRAFSARKRRLGRRRG